MIIITAVDDRNGLTFNHRRQSQDKSLREKILSLTSGSHLWMNEYSGKQFAEHPETQICTDDNFLDKAGADDFCFIENVPVSQYVNQIQKIILFKWNRHYPADLWFDIDVCSGQWHLEHTEDFTGTSHEKITMEVYTK